MPRTRDNTAHLAKALWDSVWTGEVPVPSPGDFQSRFDELYAAAEGPATFWHLGGAANDFLRRHPNSIVVPAELAELLLDSVIVDGRIIGLKLLTRCSADTGRIMAAICQALERHDDSEVCGGLCELDNLLRRLSPAVPLPPNELLSRLRELETDCEEYLRSSARRLALWLAEFPMTEKSN